MHFFEMSWMISQAAAEATLGEGQSRGRGMAVTTGGTHLKKGMTSVGLREDERRSYLENQG